MVFGFVNPSLQAQLIRIVEATPVSYSRPTSDSIEVTGHYEEAFDGMIDVVRQMRFPFWHSFRPLDPEKCEAYRTYMREHGIDHEEEIHGRTRWFLTSNEHQQYDWGIEKFNRP